MIPPGSEKATASGRGAALTVLQAIAADGARVALSENDWRELAGLAAAAQVRAAAADLMALPSAKPAPIWHLERMRALAEETGDDSEGLRAARRYHARCLAQLLAPDSTELRPLVTILIPVFNRAGPVVDAIESCLRQAWRPLEILVIDDGSTDDLQAALRPFGDSVRLHRQEQRGVASARNLGIRLAQGDFIHFLDSDDLLLPGAIDRKVAAFLSIADAELCYSDADTPPLLTLAGELPDPSVVKPSPTRDLLSAVRAGHPFSTSTVMMPRWSMLAARPFEEDLRRSEDTRYWFALGLRGTKVIGLATPLTARRKVGSSLSDLRVRSQEESITVRARDLGDLLANPELWRYAPGYYLRLAADSRYCAPFEPATGTAAGALAALSSSLAEVASGARRGGLSPLPLFAALQVEDNDWGRAARAISMGGDLDRFFASVPALIARGLRASPPLDSHDIDYWLDGGSARERQPHIDAALRRLRFDERHESGDRAALTWILRKVRLPLARRDAKRFRRLRQKTGSTRLAAWLTWGLRVR